MAINHPAAAGDDPRQAGAEHLSGEQFTAGIHPLTRKAFAAVPVSSAA